jgi:hypothetical protein
MISWPSWYLVTYLHFGCFRACWSCLLYRPTGRYTYYWRLISSLADLLIFLLSINRSNWLAHLSTDRRVTCVTRKGDVLFLCQQFYVHLAWIRFLPVLKKHWLILMTFEISFLMILDIYTCYYIICINIVTKCAIRVILCSQLHATQTHTDSLLSRWTLFDA